MTASMTSREELLETSVRDLIDILEGARSGFIAGSGTDETWDRSRASRIASAKTALTLAGPAQPSASPGCGDYSDLVAELHEAAEEYLDGHGPRQAAAANAISHLMTLLGAAQTGRSDLIEKCAKIADPWPGFNVGQKISDPDLSVIKVRTEIAATIRALCSEPSTDQREGGK
jgi:hypothetical protein